jgi:hypothetical protein
MITWRADNKNEGAFILFGPSDEMKEGEWVKVHSKSGKISNAFVGSRSGIFKVDGRDFCYGYPLPYEEAKARQAKMRELHTAEEKFMEDNPDLGFGFGDDDDF